MATRVFELARELGVTSKVVLDKCRAEDLELKNHMATLTAGLEATIREWFSEGQSHTAVETAAHVDLETARKDARKSRRRKAEHATDEKTDVSEETPEELSVEAEEPPVPEEPAPAAAVAVLEEEKAPQQAPAEVEKTVPEAPVAEEPVVEPTEVPKKKEVAPAGPQLVPRPAPLKGPRVIRVAKPDVIHPPRNRRGAGGRETEAPPNGNDAPPSTPRKNRFKPATGATPGMGIAMTGPMPMGPDAEGGKKGKRRSPRRRGGDGRSAESGEHTKEWRDQDLYERDQRLAMAGGGIRRHRANVARGQAELAAPATPTGKVEIEEPITIKNLSAVTGIKVADILKKMMSLGMMANINQVIDRDTTELIMADYPIELVIKEAKSAETVMLEKLKAREKGDLSARPPVVTFLGHVDHGKTSLLDCIRKTRVTAGEAGGITQHISSYRYDNDEKNVHVVFLDTPGHEAFTAMRARGANMTDVVVLVVAADDGLMPQTIEAINHAKAAKVPIVVALNKIDVPNANIQRALGQLAEHDLTPREWGGNTEVIRTSAITGEGIDSLVETLSLEAELLELKAEKDGPAAGYVIEAEIDPGFGVLTRILVLDGTLKLGDILVAGKGVGRVRTLRDDLGKTIKEAGPATPVEVAGLSELPEAGDRFFVVPTLEEARNVAEQRQEFNRTKELAAVPTHSLEALMGQIEAGETKELSLILKADVQGTIEAITGSLKKLGNDEARVRILHTGVGGITTGDVTLAEASKAIIIGFNVVAAAGSRQLAEAKNVDIRLYRIIYDIIEDVRRVLEEGLAPEIREEVLGRAEIRQVFKVSRVGTVAGCYVTDGVARRNAKVRIIRDNVVLEDGRTLESLKRFKDDAREVRSGMECGLKIAGYDDLKEGDQLEFYQKIEVARTL